MQRIIYEIEDRDATIAAISAAGQIIVSDVTIDLVDGRLTNCYFEVVDAPPEEPESELSDMQTALEILGVEPEEG